MVTRYMDEPSCRYDGIHMNTKQGRSVSTVSVENILKYSISSINAASSSGSSSNPSQPKTKETQNTQNIYNISVGNSFDVVGN